MNRWFLPHSSDVLALLQRQAAVTEVAMRAFVAWANGDGAQAAIVRSLEHDADREVRELRRALRASFVTPLDAEDLYVLSSRLDAVLNGAKNIVGEAEVMDTAPDGPCGEMADLVAEAVEHLYRAFCGLDGDGDAATEEADLAIKCTRRQEHVYREAMSALLRSEDLRDVMGRRELYRRFARIGDDIVEVAERVWYAVVKEA